MPGYPKRSESMPNVTIYHGDPFSPRAKLAKQTVNPLNDN